MIRYEKCPRCDLNYIDADKQEYCDVCIAELKGSKLQFADIDEDEMEEVDEELELTEICPICGVNKMRFGESSCEACKKQDEYEEDTELDIDKDEEWKNYLNDEADDMDLTIDDDALREELEADMEDEESEEEENDDEYYDGEDDDPLDDFEDLDDLDDEDYDDDEDDLDDEDDDDDDF